MTLQQDLYHPPRSLLRRYRGLSVAVLVVVAALVAGGIWYVVRPAPRVYVTDGSHDFSRSLGPVEKDIARENSVVRAEHKPYVSVAVLAPFTAGSSDIVTQAWLRHQLEGAYLAQLAANGTNGRSLPLVQVLLADEGSHESDWRQAVRKLTARTKAPDRLVAVTGLGLSVSETTGAIRALGKAGPNGNPIPMVGSVISADGLTGLPGLVRVAPTNSEEAAAAVQYLRSTRHIPAGARSMLIQDTNADDSYAATLGTAFRDSYLHPRSETFDSVYGASSTAFAQLEPTICSLRPDVVFFAGRGDDLQDLLQRLTQRTCTGKHIIVVTGDDASTLTQSSAKSLWDPQGANFEVDYTALAHPGAFKDTAAVSPSTSDQFLKGKHSFEGLFKSDNLNDGTAIMGYDALLTADDAITVAAGHPSYYPTAPAVASALNQLSGVPGASGWISFGGDSRGNPVDKAVPIVRLGSGRATTFLALSSATGTPPAAPRGG